MQEPKKIFFVKKSYQDFSGWGFKKDLSRCKNQGKIFLTKSSIGTFGMYPFWNVRHRAIYPGKKRRDPKWDPFSSDYEKVKNVVTLLIKWAHHFTRRLKLLECAHNLKQPFPSLLSARGRVLGFRVQLHLELVYLPAYLPEQVFLTVCHFASFLVYSIISLQPPTPLNCFLILVLSNAEYNFQSLQLSLCTKNVLTVG